MNNMDDYAALEAKHFGDPDKKTGIYADNNEPIHKSIVMTDITDDRDEDEFDHDNI